MSLAADIVNTILNDITEREGLGDEWDGIDDDLRAEVKGEWESRIEALVKNRSVKLEQANRTSTDLIRQIEELEKANARLASQITMTPERLKEITGLDVQQVSSDSIIVVKAPNPTQSFVDTVSTNLQQAIAAEMGIDVFVMVLPDDLKLEQLPFDIAEKLLVDVIEAKGKLKQLPDGTH